MSLRVRIVLVTAMLMTILFGIGGTILIHTTFQVSLKKEEMAAVENNELILKIVQYVKEESTWFFEEELVSVIKDISKQVNADCLRLTSEGGDIYVYQGKERLADNLKKINVTEDNEVIVSFFVTKSGDNYLQTDTRFLLNGTEYSLTIGRNLNLIYNVRREQINMFRKIFISLFFIGIILSWLLADWLTKPLRKLTKAAKEIEAGNLLYRSNINSKDEIGELSEAFDKMAMELENKIVLLEETAAQKEMFMGAFTHELKTPMTSIIGYADLLRTQQLSEKDEKDALDYIFSESKRLENMSLKMLELFVVDKGEINLKMCSPLKVCRYVTEHLQNMYAQNDVVIRVAGEEGECLLEPDLFQTLLINLLDNARKSMEHGGNIGVCVSMTQAGCRLIVSDNGKGIPREALEHLTEAFYRIDKARARSKGSVGLGLALCEKIVDLHCGSMEFQSIEGEGTTVTVSLNGGYYEK